MAAAESGDAVNSLSLDGFLLFAAVEGHIETFKQYKDCLDQLVTPNDDSILHICITALPFPNRKNPTTGNGKFINFLAEWVAESRPFPIGKNPTTGNDKFIKLAEWVAAESGRDLLKKQNKKGDTPLHIAARHGHLDIAIELVRLYEKTPETKSDQERGVVRDAAVQEMIAMKNEDGDTALHEALRLSNVYDQKKVSQLVKLLTCKRNIVYEPNKYDETPLYLAAERGVAQDVVVRIN